MSDSYNRALVTGVFAILLGFFIKFIPKLEIISCKRLGFIMLTTSIISFYIQPHISDTLYKLFEFCVIPALLLSDITINTLTILKNSGSAAAAAQSLFDNKMLMGPASSDFDNEISSQVCYMNTGGESSNSRSEQSTGGSGSGNTTGLQHWAKHINENLAACANELTKDTWHIDKIFGNLDVFVKQRILELDDASDTGGIKYMHKLTELLNVNKTVSDDLYEVIKARRAHIFTWFQLDPRFFHDDAVESRLLRELRAVEEKRTDYYGNSLLRVEANNLFTRNLSKAKLNGEIDDAEFERLYSKMQDFALKKVDLDWNVKKLNLYRRCNVRPPSDLMQAVAKLKFE